ncbi:MAG: flagellar type III secretion system protein FlhB [Paracoccaceae bacterium]
MSETDEDKEHEPSQKKLDEARARGDIPSSADLTAALAVTGLWLTLQTFGASSMVNSASVAKSYLGQTIAESASEGGLSGSRLLGWGSAFIAPLVPFFAVPALAALAGIFAQRNLVFAPEKIAPKLARLSPIRNAKNRFGSSGLVEFLKNLIKLLLVAWLVGWFLFSHLPEIVVSMQLPAVSVSALLAQLLVEFLALCAVIGLTIGGADFLWQQFDHRRRNRMSRQEMMDEFRESEGDPHMKGQRRQRAQAIALSRMLLDVPNADVVLVNPTHYAVALKWNRKSRRAPVCVAKGVDEVATRIRALASQAGVPIHSDPPTARALYAAIDIGKEIRPEYYAPVAAAIRYAEKMRQRARRGWSSPNAQS